MYSRAGLWSQNKYWLSKWLGCQTLTKPEWNIYFTPRPRAIRWNVINIHNLWVNRYNKLGYWYCRDSFTMHSRVKIFYHNLTIPSGHHAFRNTREPHGSRIQYSIMGLKCLRGSSFYVVGLWNGAFMQASLSHASSFGVREHCWGAGALLGCGSTAGVREHYWVWKHCPLQCWAHWGAEALST